MASLRLVVLICVISCASCTAGFAIKREVLEAGDDGESFIAQIVGRLEDEADHKSICGDATYSDANLDIICSFYGYDGYSQVKELSTYSLNASYVIGFSNVDCTDAVKTDSCSYTVSEEDCTTLLVVNCTEKWSITAATGSALVMPILLCTATVLLMAIMCIGDYFEKRSDRNSNMHQRNSQKEKWAANKILSVLAKGTNDGEGKKDEGKKSPGLRENKVEATTDVEEPRKYDV